MEDRRFSTCPALFMLKTPLRIKASVSVASACLCRDPVTLHPAAARIRGSSMAYSIFCTCSRSFSSSAFMATTRWAMLLSPALEPMVLNSRLNS